MNSSALDADMNGQLDAPASAGVDSTMPQDEHITKPYDETPSFAWQTSGETSTSKKMQILEEAVDDALKHGGELARELKQFLDDPQKIQAADLEDSKVLAVPQLRDWIKSFNSLAEAQKDFQVLVGVAGATGAGKTSLLNALLRHRGLLPASTQEASTATICRVAWNHDARGKNDFRAVVKFRNRSDVARDLKLFFEDLKAVDIPQDDNERGEESEADASEAPLDDAAIKEWLNKIFAVWRYDEDQLREMSVDDILKKDYGPNKLLSTTKTISSREVEEFAQRIKPYLDSTTIEESSSGEEIEFQVWPLVEHVELYICAPILQHGIVFVDLPGLADAVESRAAIAKKFFNELAVTTIVTPIVRAADESTASSLLTENQALSMQLDNKLHSRSFCIVASKMDDMDTKTYLQSQSKTKMGSEVRASQQNLTEWEEEVQELEKEDKAEEKKTSNLRKAKNAAKSKANKHTRTAGELKKLKNQIHAVRKHSLDLKRKIARRKENIAYTQRWLKHYCVASRNAHVTTRIQNDFKQRQARLGKKGATSAHKKNEDTIRVFPVSVQDFWTHKDHEDRKQPGFPSIRYTGIPSLEAWIGEATTPERESHALSVLNNLHSLLNSVHTWSDDQCQGQKINYNAETVDDEIVKPFNQALNENWKYCGDCILKEIKEVNPLRNYQAIMRIVRPVIRALVERWILRDPQTKRPVKTADRIHYQVHAAILRRKGGRYLSRGKTRITYAWVEDMANAILSELVDTWNEAFHNHLPKAADVARARVESGFNTALPILKERLLGLFPGQVDYLESQIPTLFAIKNQVSDRIHEALMTVSTEACAIHRSVEPSVEKGWKRGFEEALVIKSKGALQKRHKFLQEYAKKRMLGIVKDAGKSMEEQLKEKLAEVPDKLNQAWAFGIDRTTAQLDLIIKNILETEYPEIQEQRLLSTKLQLQEKVRPHINTWINQWKAPSAVSKMDMDQDVSIPETYEVDETHESGGVVPELTESESDPDSDTETDTDTGENVDDDEEDDETTKALIKKEKAAVKIKKENTEAKVKKEKAPTKVNTAKGRAKTKAKE